MDQRPVPPDLARLLEAYFDDRITPAEMELLTAHLRTSPENRRAYWEASHWQTALTTWGEQQVGSDAAKTVPFAPAAKSPPRGKLFPRLAGLGWLAAACLALAAIFIWRRQTPPLAELTYQNNAVWQEAAPKNGHELQNRLYRLSRGVIRFETRAGAVVTLAGPAEFNFTAADRIEMIHGKLTARMLGPSSQLTVKVGEMEVRDLGTAFGIDANDMRHTLVSVFDGLVAVTSRAAQGGEVQLAEGQSMVDHRGSPLATEATQFNPDAFKDIWPLTIGINEASRLVEFLPPGPLLRPLREYRANDRVFLFPEKQQALVGEPLSLDVSVNAPTWPECPVSPYPVGPGERVNSYLVFFQPDPAVSVLLRRLTGEITFQHRIIGVICTDSALNDSDGALGIADTDYSTPGQRRGLEATDQECYRGGTLPHDSITISEDGRTVRFDLFVSNEREQMRVLINPD